MTLKSENDDGNHPRRNGHDVITYQADNHVYYDGVEDYHSKRCGHDFITYQADSYRYHDEGNNYHPRRNGHAVISYQADGYQAGVDDLITLDQRPLPLRQPLPHSSPRKPFR